MRLGSAESDRRGCAHEPHKSQAIFRRSKAHFRMLAHPLPVFFGQLIENLTVVSRAASKALIAGRSAASNTEASLRTRPGHTPVCTDSFRRATFEFGWRHSFRCPPNGALFPEHSICPRRDESPIPFGDSFQSIGNLGRPFL